MPLRAPLFPISGVEPAASSSISPLTAPTAAPTRFKAGDVQRFNLLLTQLLTDAQNIDTTGFQQRETNLQEESLRRAGQSFVGTPSDQLSPAQQAQVRGAGVGATEVARELSQSQRKEFEGKVEGLPNLLTALSKFADSFEEEGDKIISHTFKEDPDGNVTWIGINQNNEVIERPVGKVGKGFKDTGDGVSGVGFTPTEKKKISALEVDKFPPEVQNKIVNLLTSTQQQQFIKAWKEATKNQSVDPAVFFEEWFAKNAGSSGGDFDWSTVITAPPVK